jgi:hypothetical protein
MAAPLGGSLTTVRCEGLAQSRLKGQCSTVLYLLKISQDTTLVWYITSSAAYTDPPTLASRAIGYRTTCAQN